MADVVALDVEAVALNEADAHAGAKPLQGRLPLVPQHRLVAQHARLAPETRDGVARPGRLAAAAVEGHDASVRAVGRQRFGEHGRGHLLLHRGERARERDVDRVPVDALVHLRGAEAFESVEARHVQLAVRGLHAA